MILRGKNKTDERYLEEAAKIKVALYHGGLNPKERKNAMKSWLDEKNPIMVATNAFGMGIDKPNVRFVAHFELPNNPEAYFQEAGRAGRDTFRRCAETSP